jgi:hypothetical protein
MRSHLAFGVFTACLVSFSFGQGRSGPYVVPQDLPHNRSDIPSNPTILAREHLADSLNRIAYKETAARAEVVARVLSRLFFPRLRWRAAFP